MCYTDTTSGRKDVVRDMSYGLWDMMCSGNIEIKEENIMHELGIVFHIAKKVESLAVENHVRGKGRFTDWRSVYGYSGISG